MRTALISDIHGSYDGLLAVLTDIKQRQCDRILCLGDLVDGGPNSVEVVRLVQELAIPTVQGNYDEHPNTSLPRDIEDYLRCLEKVSALSYPIPYDAEFSFDPDDRYIVCVGAVGPATVPSSYLDQDLMIAISSASVRSATAVTLINGSAMQSMTISATP